MISQKTKIKFEKIKKITFRHNVWIFLFVFYVIVAFSIFTWFNGQDNQIGNNITLLTEVFLGIFIAIIAYKQNQQTKKVSQFFENQLNYIKEDIGRCLVSTFEILYPTTSKEISGLEYARLKTNELSPNIKILEFHHLHNSIYLETPIQNILGQIILQMKIIDKRGLGILPLLTNILLSLERNFPNKYTQEIDFLFQDFIKKTSEKYPVPELQNLSLYNTNVQRPYRDFIIKTIYNVKDLSDWIMIHIEFPVIDMELNNFKRRTEIRIESLNHAKNIKKIQNLKTEEIDFLIEIYSNALKIFKITHTNEIILADLETFLKNLKIFVKRYESIIDLMD